MKHRLLAATLIAFAIGAASGWATRSRATPHVQVKESHGPATDPPQAAVELRSAPSNAHLPAPKVVPKILLGKFPSPRQEALGLLLDLVSREQLQGALIHVVWGDAAMDRKALELFRGLKDPADLDLFVELELLGYITDPTVRSEVSQWIRTERDPQQKRRLALIVAAPFQTSALYPVIEDVLTEPDPDVSAAILKNLFVFRFDREARAHWAHLIRPLAGSERPENQRVAALRSLRGAFDEGTTRFLMHAALTDPKPEAVIAALGSLPDGSDLSDRMLAVEMIRMAYALATDEAKSVDVRRAAAIAADVNDLYGEDKILTAAEQELIAKIAYSQDEE